jgi:L-threonylcarbamoyladenylate synthase
MSVLKATEDNIQRASKVVKNGGIIIYPTDTVYGLGCSPFNAEAVKRIFKTKGERKDKPLPILSSDKENVQKIAYLNEKARKIAQRFWPGALMLVVKKKPSLPDIVTCGSDSVGVRIPKHAVAIRLISLCDGLLVGTSANKTGEKPPKTATEAAKQLGEQVDLILDGGPSPLGEESSVVDLTAQRPRMLRRGPIKLEEILRVLQSLD